MVSRFFIVNKRTRTLVHKEGFPTIGDAKRFIAYQNKQYKKQGYPKPDWRIVKMKLNIKVSNG